MEKYILLIALLYGLHISNSVAEDAPRFDNGILTIPRVDTPEQIGQYQNVQFKLSAEGHWELLAATPAFQALIDDITIQILESFPVQIHVQVSGNLPTPCRELGPIHQRFSDNFFEIAIHVTQLQTFVACAQVLEPFQTTIPLDVYGLPQGRYQVRVNDKSANFELTADNLMNYD